MSNKKDTRQIGRQGQGTPEPEVQPAQPAPHCQRCSMPIDDAIFQKLYLKGVHRTVHPDPVTCIDNLRAQLEDYESRVVGLHLTGQEAMITAACLGRFLLGLEPVYGNGPAVLLSLLKERMGAEAYSQALEWPDEVVIGALGAWHQRERTARAERELQGVATDTALATGRDPALVQSHIRKARVLAQIRPQLEAQSIEDQRLKDELASEEAQDGL